MKRCQQIQETIYLTNNTILPLKQNKQKNPNNPHSEIIYLQIYLGQLNKEED